jgi:hypothetical protein
MQFTAVADKSAKLLRSRWHFERYTHQQNVPAQVDCAIGEV